MNVRSRKRGAPIRALRLLPFVVLGFGILTTFILWWSAHQSILGMERFEFDRRRDQVRILITRRLEEQVTMLRATAAGIAIDPELTRSQFRAFANTLNLKDNYPDLVGVGYAYRVDLKNRSAFDDDMQRQGLAGFTTAPKEYVGEQYPIRYLEPQSGRNLRAIGYNMYSERNRRLAMATARDTGLPTATGKVVLVQDREVTDEPGFLIYVPIYEGGATPETVAARRDKLVGFAYSPIRADQFFDGVLKQRGSPDIGLAIYSGFSEEPGNLLFTYEPTSFANQPVFHRNAETIELAGIIWKIRYTAPSYESAVVGSSLLPWIFTAGLLISVLVFGAAWRQVIDAEEARNQAVEANRRAERERFVSEAGKVLSSTLDARTSLDRLASLAVPDFAEWVTIDLIDLDGNLERVAIHHVDSEQAARAREMAVQYPAGTLEKSWISKAVKTGRSVWYPAVLPEHLVAIARDENHLRQIQSFVIQSVIVVPLQIRGEVLGAISFVSADVERPYDEDDFKLALEVATRAAVAVDNARLYEAAQREVAERRKAEQTVRDLNANLERIVDERTKELRASNNELEAFCYSVSHDLRTPLRSVDGFSKALIEDFGAGLPDEARGYLDRVRNASHRMDELISALLTLSRITRSEIARTEVDVTEVASTVVHEALRGIEPDKVRLTIQPGMRAKADAHMVRIVFDNLIANAVKFSAQSDPRVIEIGCANGVFFVRDNGVGFNPEYKAKLFAPFERLHSPREFPGTGVGLATVQRIVRRHGGEIWAESREGCGATFSFTLC